MARQEPVATGETLRLAEFCANLSFDQLDEEVVTAVEKRVVDLLASSYAGTSTEPGEIMLNYVGTLGGDEATVVGGGRSLAQFAALANGTTAHALDVDDGHRAASAHPGSAIIPAALAIAEKHDCSGRDLVVAIAAGYEAMIKTAVAVQTSHRERHFHATATSGCFGSAVAVASLLDLDTDGVADALGLGGTQAGGLFEFLAKGSMVKRFHPGRAALAGVLAGELAANDYDGPDTIIEGEEGFARAFADEYDLTPFDNLGSPFEIVRSYIKPYPSCRHTHGPIEGALDLRDEIDLESIVSIRVETYHTASLHDKVAVENLLDAQMSIPYCVTVALIEGAADLAQFDPPKTDARIRSMLERIEVVATDEMESSYPAARPARVVVETTNGGRHSTDVDYPFGAAENPMSEVDLREKFHDLAADSLSESRCERILDLAFDVETLDDVTTLTSQL